MTMPLQGELRFKIFIIYLFKLSNYQRRRIIKYANCPINNEWMRDQSYTYDIFLLCPYKYCLHKHIFCDAFSHVALQKTLFKNALLTYQICEYITTNESIIVLSVFFFGNVYKLFKLSYIINIFCLILNILLYISNKINRHPITLQITPKLA